MFFKNYSYKVFFKIQTINYKKICINCFAISVFLFLKKTINQLTFHKLSVYYYTKEATGCQQITAFGTTKIMNTNRIYQVRINPVW